MSTDPVQAILAAHQQKLKEEQTAEPSEADDRFFSVSSVQGLTEGFFEIRFRTGTQTCFAYHDLAWFNYSKDEGLIDLGFGLFIVTIKGRGLAPRLFDAIKAKRIAWIREADTEMQDTPEFECYVESITLTPPEGFGGDEEESES